MHDKKDPSLDERVRAATELLERMAGDWSLLEALPKPDRERLQRVVARLYHPDRIARRKRVKATEQERRAERNRRDDGVRNYAELEDAARACGALAPHETMEGANEVRFRVRALRELGMSPHDATELGLVRGASRCAKALGVPVEVLRELVDACGSVRSHRGRFRFDVYNPVEIAELRNHPRVVGADCELERHRRGLPA